MPDGLKSFFDTYANAFVAIGAVVGVLTLLFAIFTYYLPRRDPPKNVQRADLPAEQRSSKIVYAARVLAAAIAQGTKLAWRYVRNLASKLWFAALYYIPGIKYEVPEPEIEDDRLAAKLRESSVFFSERFADAFPAIREPAFYDRTSDIAHRLGILLRPPLSVWTKGRTRRPTPIYWLGGLGNLHIEHWTRIKPHLFLMDVMELDIARMVAIPGAGYWQNFVYVECRALRPTGLYGPLPKDLVGLPDHLPSAEEYAVYGHRIFTRREYDDGGYVRRGRVRQFKHSPQLRVRHLVPFNFLIVPAMSPANRSQLDRTLAIKLAECLRDPNAIHSLAEWLFTLPKREAPGD